MRIVQNRVVLHRTLAKAAEAASAAAQSSPLANLGVEHTTAAAYVESRWDLWGSGRRIITSLQRSLLVAHLLDASPLNFSPKAQRSFEQFIARNAAQALHKGIPQMPSASPEEKQVVLLLQKYFQILDERKLIELDEAAYQLSQASALGAMPKDQIDPSGIRLAQESWGVQALLREQVLESDPSNTSGARGEAGKVVIPPLGRETAWSFLVAKGARAIPLLAKAECLALPKKQGKACLICSPDPQALFRSLAPALVQEGYSCALTCSIPLTSTAVGRMIHIVRSLIQSQGDPVALGTDYAFNPLSGMAAFQAVDLNTGLRMDRTVTCLRVAERLEQKSPSWKAWHSLVQGQHERAAFEVLAQLIAQCFSKDRAQAALERRALGRLKEYADALEDMGIADLDYLSLALEGSVALSLLREQEGAPLIEVASLSRLDSITDNSYEEVLLADASEAGFPLAQSRTAFDRLAETWGWEVSDDPLNRQRERFAQAVRATKERFCCILPERDQDGAEVYPAFVLDEFIAAQKAQKEQNGFPVQDAAGDLVASVRMLEPDEFATCGEDDLPAAVGNAHGSPHDVLQFEKPHHGVLKRFSLTDYLWSCTLEDTGKEMLVMSPSAIENYLSCPYFWFTSKVIRINGIDEEFGPREKGLFAHAVFARFYQRLAEQGMSQISAEGLDSAQQVMHQAFDEVLKEQSEGKAGSGRLVMNAASEQFDVDRLLEQMLKSVQRLAELPPDYQVLAHEKAISPDDRLTYAGVVLNGRIDRVDVNDAQKRYVVLDYKGDVKSYAAGVKEEKADNVDLPEHVQALIYAQALRQLGEFGDYHCAGALYLGYRARTYDTTLAGSADPSFEAPLLMKDDSRVEMNFEAYLDRVESLIKERLDRLRGGFIEAQPLHKTSCQYCPVGECERRLS